MLMQRLCFLVMATMLPLSSLAAADVDALWDFKQPALSEQRFRDALATAQGDDRLILQTQIARSLGLRRNFAGARELLASLQPALATASPEARIRHALEVGRTHASATHKAEEITPTLADAARAAYQRALDLATTHRLDGLAIDAIHMFAFIDTAPTDQLRWGRQALGLAQSSSDPVARRWEASIRNNIGMALHQLGRFDEALQHFNAAVPLREAMGDAARTRVALWMVAWTLRALGRIDDALSIQSRLERENDAANLPDPYVFEELELLHRSQARESRAADYAQRRAALRDHAR